MTNRGLGGLVAVFAAVAMAVTGCSSGTDTGAQPDRPNPPVADRPDAGSLLPQSFKKIREESFRFTSTMTMGDTKVVSKGAFDMARTVGEATIDMGGGRQMELRVLGSDVYLQVTGRWMHLKSDQLPSGHMFGDAANPVANADYLLAVSDDVEDLGDGRYKGTLDLTKYADEYADPKDAEALKKLLSDLGPEASTVPFEATVDDEGRLTGLKTTMTITRHGEKTTVVQDSTYSDFGTKVAVRKPPADKTVEAPAGLYKD